MQSTDRIALETRWLQLTRQVLPALAVGRRWPVVNDHCFQRILLDSACGGVWYAHVSARPAYRHLDDDRLAAAVELAESVVEGTIDLTLLNDRSLAWRGKAPTPRRR